MSSRRAYLVVGASGTIGAAVAAQLAAPEIGLGLHYRRNPAAAHELAARLATAGALCEPLQSDLADETGCRGLVERCPAGRHIRQVI